jgi:hypothetical protein
MPIRKREQSLSSTHFRKRNAFSSLIYESERWRRQVNTLSESAAWIEAGWKCRLRARRSKTERRKKRNGRNDEQRSG